MATLRFHILQHVPFEGPAAIADWVAYNGYTMSTTHLYVAGSKFPDLDHFDALVVMGGPMGVHDTAQYSWLLDEMAFVRKALDAGKKVLGVCLGAQIIAYVLGAAVSQNEHREIGWFPVMRNPELTVKTSAMLPESFPAFHWHGQTFALPEGAVLLASSLACRNQAFLWKHQALAVQFHLETTPASAEALLANAETDLQGEHQYVQLPEVIRQGARDHEAILHRCLGTMLEQWLAL